MLIMKEDLSSSNIPVRKGRKKLRRLADSVDVNCQSNISIRTKIRIVLVSMVLCGIFAWITAPNSIENLGESYRRYYLQTLHGRHNYCVSNFDNNGLFKKLKKNIIHQDRALLQLKMAFKNESAAINSIAIIGKQGVGKSLLAHNLAKYWPWPENVHFYLWNSFIPQSSTFDVLRLFVEQRLFDCGINMFIIDNIPLWQYTIVKLLNNAIAKYRAVAKKYFNVIVLYIFTEPSIMDQERETAIAAHMELLSEFEHLPNTTIIRFKPFGPLELTDCITNELMIEDLSINAEGMREIAATINVQQSGCKNVRAKVLALGNSRRV